jgi:hypothetical protein
MKRKLIIACLASAVFSSCATQRGRNELPSSSPRAAEIEKALNQTVLPEVDLENVALQDAVRIWSESSRTHHPQHFDFRHMISYPMTLSMQQGKQNASHSVSSAVSTPKPAKITVHRKNITSRRLLDEICQQSNFVWTILGRVIVIRPRDVASSPQP